MEQNRASSVSYLLFSRGREQVAFSFSILSGPRTKSDRVTLLRHPEPSLKLLSQGLHREAQGCQQASVSSCALCSVDPTSSTGNQPRRETDFLLSHCCLHVTTPSDNTSAPFWAASLLWSCFCKSVMCMLFEIHSQC